jgi:hypothetical protein
VARRVEAGPAGEFEDEMQLKVVVVRFQRKYDEIVTCIEGISDADRTWFLWKTLLGNQGHIRSMMIAEVC